LIGWNVNVSMAVKRSKRFVAPVAISLQLPWDQLRDYLLGLVAGVVVWASGYGIARFIVGRLIDRKPCARRKRK